MNPYIQKLNQYMSENPLAFEESSAEDILELLWWAYSEDHPVDTAQVKAQFERLAEIWNTLSPAHSDLLFNVTCTLCLEYERLAFREGFKVGLHLAAAE